MTWPLFLSLVALLLSAFSVVVRVIASRRPVSLDLPLPISFLLGGFAALAGYFMGYGRGQDWATLCGGAL